MHENELYQPPKVEKVLSRETVQAENGYRDGIYLFIKKGFVSPPVCIVSGEPVDPTAKRYKFRVSYLPSLALLLLFLSLPGLLLIAVLQKSIVFEVSLAEQEAKKFVRNKLIILGAFLMSIIAFILGVMFANPYGPGLGGILLLFSAIWAITQNRLVKVVRYKKKYFQLRKAHPNFLEEIPKSINSSSSLDSLFAQSDSTLKQKTKPE